MQALYVRAPAVLPAIARCQEQRACLWRERGKVPRPGRPHTIRPFTALSSRSSEKQKGTRLH
jgi:hypothetical protein